MTPWPYPDPPPTWWNGGPQAAAEAARLAIAESERLRRAGQLKVERGKVSGERAIDVGLWEEDRGDALP